MRRKRKPCFHKGRQEYASNFFNPENTSIKGNSKIPAHGPINSPAYIHFALEIETNDYGNYKNMLIRNGIDIEEMVWDNGSRSIYFRDPAGNFVELITEKR